MPNRARAVSILVSALVSGSSQTGAYELATHSRLAHEAVLGSRLARDDVLREAAQLPDPNDAGRTLPGKQGMIATARALVMQGAQLEDLDPTVRRVVNHFFDPIHPDFRIAPGACLSPDFAMGDCQPAPAFVYGTQEDSYAHARQSFFDALTAETQGERDDRLGRTFVTLGQVVHHIQDMAQPQHTRNDRHGGGPFNLLGAPSLYEHMVDEIFGALTTAPAPVPPAGNLDAGPRGLWIHPTGSGLAQFTNRNYVSAGTNFRGTASNIQTDPNYPDPHFTVGQDTIDTTTWGQIKAESPADLVRAVTVRRTACRLRPRRALVLRRAEVHDARGETIWIRG
jgi:hypothetical protein